MANSASIHSPTSGQEDYLKEQAQERDDVRGGLHDGVSARVRDGGLEADKSEVDTSESEDSLAPAQSYSAKTSSKPQKTESCDSVLHPLGRGSMGETPVDTHVGADIRSLRKSRGMTLNELCDALGRSVGWLSQVERGQTDPSIPDLKSIAGLFLVPVSFFFRHEDAPEDERGWIVRAGARAVMGSSEDGLKEELLSPDISGEFEMIRSVFAPGAMREVMPARNTQDGGYIVSGTLEMTIGSHIYVLGPGDSFQFDRQPYGWRNIGNEAAVVIWIISPPVY